jgi:hypothetical protein
MFYHSLVDLFFAVPSHAQLKLDLGKDFTIKQTADGGDSDQ